MEVKQRHTSTDLTQEREAMTIRRKMRKTTSLLVAAASPLLVPRPAEAIIIIGGSQAHFGPFGLTRDHTARLSVGNATRDPTSGLRCDAHLTFYDARGGVAAESDVSVPVGASGYAQVAFEEVVTNPPDGDKRQVLRATAVLANPPDPDRVCVGTLEVFDKSGKTQYMLGGPDTIPEKK
jgi:hypothetical protein